MSARDSVRRLFESAMMNARAVISDMKTRRVVHQKSRKRIHVGPLREQGWNTANANYTCGSARELRYETQLMTGHETTAL